MAEKKPFVLRMNADILKELQRWADDEFRSLNGQLEYLLQQALNEKKKKEKGKSWNAFAIIVHTNPEVF